MNKLRTLLLVFVLAVLPSCTALDALDVFKPKPSIEVNANVGKNVKQEKSSLKIDGGSNTEQTADTINNNEKTEYKARNINQTSEKIPPYIIVLLIMFAGFVIPSAKVSLGFVTKSVKGLGRYTKQLVIRKKEAKKAPKPL